MSKPDDIPQDVWNTASTCGAARTDVRRTIISRTILAAKAEERAACAQIVDDERERILSKQDGKDDGVDHNLRMIAVLFPDIAAAIRNRGAK